MVTTKLFRSNTTQAVRLPQEVAFPADTEVAITVEGTSRVITPVAHTWDRWFETARSFEGQFPDRAQPAEQERAEL